MASSERDQTKRPDPDALLALSEHDRRGRLKVFLGAAPGVGKTYAMLQGARRLKAEGADVVIGLVETHGRHETKTLLEGLEVLPRRNFEYRGRQLEEFDIDAALARRPRLLVVDELAHTNAAESRHPKRWQDVEELLDAGIDVWTALNIQHLESLADIVSRITGVVVRETVPDKVLRDAADVVLVDITPDELIDRLNEGKVYVPETARRATQNFFTPGNLTALRELALRRTADRVDDQMVDYLRQKAIEGPWGTSERLLVCIGAGQGAEMLVRTASRLATGLNATWLAVHVERLGTDDLDAPRAKRIGEILQLAERLGAEVTRLNSRDFTADILRLARRENVTQIVIGRASRGFVRRFLQRSLPDQLVRQVQDIAVHIVATAEEPLARHAYGRWWRRDRLVLEVAAAILSTGAAIGVGHLLSLWLKLPNLSMVFLAAVLFCAVYIGTRAAVFTALLSFVGYNFFFIPPLHTFTIAEPHELFSLLIFLTVAVLTGSLAGRVRDQSQNMLKRVGTTQSLYEFSRTLSGAPKVDDVLWASASHIHKMLGGKAVLLVPKDGELQPWAAWPPDEPLDAAQMSAAQWAFGKAESAGWRTGTLPNVQYQFRPLLTSRGVVGVCGYQPVELREPLKDEEERNLAAILEQAAIALDRALLVGEAVKAAALQENEMIRDALLASLSHDFRTPLTAITGAVTTLRELGENMSGEERQKLLLSIEQESARLSRFVINLLDMSRIESGAVKAKRDWVDVRDVIRAAAERSRKYFPENQIIINLAPDLPFVRGDAHLLEQVLFNLLDNAHKYGGGGGAVIHARREADDVVISVTDEGPGVKPAHLDRIFEKFYRGGKADGRQPGTGLGLSICRGLIAAMGGTIIAQSPAIRRRGTRLVIRLPAADPASGMKEDRL